MRTYLMARALEGSLSIRSRRLCAFIGASASVIALLASTLSAMAIFSEGEGRALLEPGRGGGLRVRSLETKSGLKDVPRYKREFSPAAKNFGERGGGDPSE